MANTNASILTLNTDGTYGTSENMNIINSMSLDDLFAQYVILLNSGINLTTNSTKADNIKNVTKEEISKTLL